MLDRPRITRITRIHTRYTLSSAPTPRNKKPRRSGVFSKQKSLHHSSALRHLHDPKRIAPLLEQLRLAFLRLVQVRFLDVAVAADVLRNAGDFSRKVHVRTIQLAQQAFDRAE